MSFNVPVRILLQELSDVSWDLLGTHLGLSQSDIRDIERDHQHTWRRKCEMFDKWLKKEEKPSWTKIVAALEGMSEANLASRLKKKYLRQQLYQQLTGTRRMLTVHKRDPIVKELASLSLNYHKLFLKAESAVMAAKPSPHQLKRFFRMYLPDEMAQTTVEGLFHCLEGYPFLNYSLLELVILLFLKELDDDVKVYTQQLTDFETSTTMIEFMESIENAHKPDEGIACTVILCLGGGEWIQKAVDELKVLLNWMFQNKTAILAYIKIMINGVTIEDISTQSTIITSCMHV